MAGWNAQRARSCGKNVTKSLIDVGGENAKLTSLRRAAGVSNAHRSCRPCATALGGHHEALNATARERMRDTLHIQMVNSRCGQLKGFPRDFQSIATRYLDSYLRWFYRIGLVATPSQEPASLPPRAYSSMIEPYENVKRNQILEFLA